MRGRVQLGLFVAARAVYDIARWVWAGELGPATENGHRVMDLEHATGTGVERSVQQALDAGWATWLRPIVALSVVATGNHYVFDIAAGLVVSIAGYMVGTRVSRMLAARPLRIARPALGPSVAEAPA
jgi:hypothetical protein